MPIVGDRRNPYPPPAEVLYFLIHDEERREKGYKFPSPLGELYFLINICLLVAGKIQPFPSPLGELYFLIVYTEISITTKGFPSPLGELYFLMKRVFMMVSLVAVSVPSRGAIFLNPAHRADCRTEGVSVPSRIVNKQIKVFPCEYSPSYQIKL